MTLQTDVQPDRQTVVSQYPRFLFEKQGEAGGGGGGGGGDKKIKMLSAAVAICIFRVKLIVFCHMAVNYLIKRPFIVSKHLITF